MLNMAINSPGCPLLGRPLTANFFKTTPGSSDNAVPTASPMPPMDEVNENQ